jgi:peptidoglycan/xylan/chitin deacetylase (PgdA/CDA1 family)
LKKIGFLLFRAFQAHRISRFLNRDKLLILAYHGITKKNYEINPWIQIPLDAFEKQILYLKQRYSIIPLERAAEIIRNGKRLPKNPAVITFDDGYKNNYTVALPILEKYSVPATIFVSSGYIGTNKILPLDKAYLFITALKGSKPLTFPEVGLGPLLFYTNEDIANSVDATIKCLKNFPVKKQENILNTLEGFLPNNIYSNNDILEDFLLLSWSEIKNLLDTGLISVGAHTVTHDILTNLTPLEAARQIDDSKSFIQENTKGKVTLFAYPNGTEADYNIDHISHLKASGFMCSVTTTPVFNNADCNLFKMGRFSIGPELSADINHFILKTSGFLPSLKTL